MRKKKMLPGWMFRTLQSMSDEGYYIKHRYENKMKVYDIALSFVENECSMKNVVYI